MNGLIRGIRATKTASAPLPATGSKLLPCYIGLAPYWQTGSNWADLAGQAFVVSSLEEFTTQMGYYEPNSGKWPQHMSLCEAAAAHFKYADNPVGPIICIIDATQLATASAAAANITFSGGTATLAVSGLAILSTIVMTGKTLGTDYSVAYDAKGQNLVFTDLSGALGTEEVNYDTVTIPSPLTLSANTLTALDTMDQDISKHPCIVAAPGWEASTSGSGTVGSALQALISTKLGGHWYVQAAVQLASSAYASVATDKTSAAYTAAGLRVCWPYGSKDGLVYHLATLMLVAKELLDASAGVPYQSASNKAVGIDYPCDSSGNKLRLTEAQADALNAIGVMTLKWVNGEWRTWGNRMANYSDGVADTLDPEEISDAVYQMLDFICNDFQERNMDVIDAPMSNRQARAVVDDYQVQLNAYNALEAILYGRIYLDPTANTTRALQAGDLTYGIKVTPTPPINSITAETQYSATGLAAITGGGS